LIDMHIHVVTPNLPGAGSLGADLELPAADLAAVVRAEMAEAGLTAALAMGCLDGPPGDPLGIAGTLAVANHVPGLFAIGAMDPRRSDRDHLRGVDAGSPVPRSDRKVGSWWRISRSRARNGLAINPGLDRGSSVRLPG
jgi:hypothetical protein